MTCSSVEQKYEVPQMGTRYLWVRSISQCTNAHGGIHKCFLGICMNSIHKYASNPQIYVFKILVFFTKTVEYVFSACGLWASYVSGFLRLWCTSRSTKTENYYLMIIKISISSLTEVETSAGKSSFHLYIVIIIVSLVISVLTLPLIHKKLTSCVIKLNPLTTWQFLFSNIT